MLKVVTLLWEPNGESAWFSRCYDETWVTRLHDGFRRNLTIAFEFILFTDKLRELPHKIRQIPIKSGKPDYGTCIEPYWLDEPMILCGLDTVVTGNCDQLARYCLMGDVVALPRDPFNAKQACNGVALVPKGQRAIYDEWSGENDMIWVRKRPHKLIDDLFPGKVQSYKGAIKKHGLGDTRIAYFHGDEKPHQLMDIDWIQKHWLGNAA